VTKYAKKANFRSREKAPGGGVFWGGVKQGEKKTDGLCKPCARFNWGAVTERSNSKQGRRGKKRGRERRDPKNRGHKELLRLGEGRRVDTVNPPGKGEIRRREERKKGGTVPGRTRQSSQPALRAYEDRRVGKASEKKRMAHP